MSNMSCRQISRLAAMTLLLTCAAPASAVTITIVNNDGAAEGFNDPTPVAPVTGNPGTTRGQQRLIAFQAAADSWGAALTSNVTIVVNATMDPLTPCSPSGGVLGQAGTTLVFRDFAGAPHAATWYHSALANALAGSDLDPGADIQAMFNSDVDDNSNCLSGTTWWYGVGAPPPAGMLDFYTVVRHEIGHGIGFSTFVNVTTGSKFLGFDDTYMRNLEDHSLGLTWPPMTNGQRAASATDTSDLHWVGNNAVAHSSVLSGGVGAGGHIQMYAPASLELGSSVSHWDTAVTPNELMEPFITPDAADLVTSYLLQDVGWTVTIGIFADGFESGDTSAWAVTVP